MAQESFFERVFKLKAHGTDKKTEIMAGITTFMTMSYILAVNPQILSESGMDYGAVFSGTIIASVVAMLIMAFYANMPLAYQQVWDLMHSSPILLLCRWVRAGNSH